MKPNFALKLSNDGVELLHRAAAGWSSVGAVSFEDDDVASACARLVAEGQRLEPAGIRSKLIIPDSEVRYATVVAPGPTDEARRYQIESEIERLTPYRIEELAYDWSVEEDHALVVICARETLIEAETFAEGYGFNPVSFVAKPEAGQFVGEPFFGETMVAPTLLPPGAQVQPDSEPVRIVPVRRADAGFGALLGAGLGLGGAKGEASAKAGDAAAGGARSAPVAPPVAAPVAAPPAAAPVVKPVVASAAGNAAASAPGVAAKGPAAPVAPERVAQTVTGGAPVKPAPPRGPASRAIPAGMPDFSAGVGEARAKVGDLVRRMGTRLRREQVAAAASEAVSEAAGGAAGVKPVSATDVAPAAPILAPAVPMPAARVAAVAVPPVAAAGAGASTGSAATATATAAMASRPAPGTAAPGTGPGTGPATAGAGEIPEPVAFASRRRPAPVAGGGGAGSGANPGGRIAVLPGQADTAGAFGAGQWLRRVRGTARKALGGLGASGAAAKAAVRSGAAAARPAKAEPLPPIVAASRPPVTDREKVREAEAMTIFGARGMQRSESGLARRGLMAVGGMLMLLIAVAVWALYFNVDDGPTQLAAGETGSGAALPAIAAPSELGARAAVPEAQPAPPVALTAPEPVRAPEAAEPEAAQPEAAQPALAAGTGETSDPEAMLETLVQEALNESLPAGAIAEQTPGELVESAAPPSEAVAQTPLAEAGEVAGELAAGGLTAGGPTAAVQDAAEPATDPAASGGETALGGSQLASAARPAQRLSLPTGLEQLALAEVPFTAPPPPPPFGTQFTFDARGLVEATPEGALTPSGVTVFARRPSVAPVPRPAGIAPEAEAVTPAAEGAAPVETSAEAPVAAPAGTVASAIETAIAEAVGAAPEAVTEAVPEAVTETVPEAPAAEVVYDDTPRADPALAGARPQPRPERVRALGEELAPTPADAEVPGDQTGLQPEATLVLAAVGPEAASVAGLAPAGADAGAAPDAGVEATRGGDAAEVTELAALQAAPPGGVSLALLRPQRRPSDLAPAAPEAAAPEAPAAAEAPALDLSGATPEAVAQSPVPGARPDDVAERARRILAAATAAPAPRAGVAVQEDEDDAGETASAAAAPVIPSAASVTRAATETNAIRLNRINLIGVFGTPNDRRALVRLSNGRVVRVQVGDRLDGGQVAAIGDAEVRYVKNGRNEVLRIGG